MYRHRKIVNYIPRRGDLVWLEFNPQLGKEIRKRRPAFVFSPQLYKEI
ncbi:MAG: type II toxin-antitoxin system PemK/MazF family toxin [Janthinobacterium lividum]